MSREPISFILIRLFSYERQSNIGQLLWTGARAKTSLMSLRLGPFTKIRDRKEVI